jgi:membrane protease YdiL (CAAX protease family)
MEEKKQNQEMELSSLQMQYKRIAEIGCMILVISVVFKIMHFPQPHFFALVGLSFLLIAALVYWLRQRRGRNHGKV